jgi:hypothetical protein
VAKKNTRAIIRRQVPAGEREKPDAH